MVTMVGGCSGSRIVSFVVDSLVEKFQEYELMQLASEPPQARLRISMPQSEVLELNTSSKES